MKRFISAFLISTIFFTSIFILAEKVFFQGSDKEQGLISQDDRKPTGELDQEEDDDEPDEDILDLLLLGVDEGGLKPKKGVRTDTIMAIRVNFDTGKIKLVTIPRDSRVDVNGKMDKINHAHSYGGIDLALATVNNFLSTDIDNYLRVDFNSIIKIVDIIGGVEMDVPVNMRYDDPTAKPPLHINLKKGNQVLNGQKSIELLRFRHNNGTDYYPGGYSREAVQQMWLKEFIKSVLDLKNIKNIPKILEKSIGSVDTNLAFSQILKYGVKAKNLKVEDLEMYTIPLEGDGKLIKGAFYFIPDEEATKELAAYIFKDGPKPQAKSEETN